MNPLAFSELALDREADPHGLPAWHVVVGPAGVAVDGERLARRPGATPVLLGVQDGQALYGRWSAEPDLLELREAGGALEASESGLAAYATSLLAWHETHSHCPACGAVTEIGSRGSSRRCPRCGRRHFPRTDPVVIMAVGDGERLLLGRRAGAPERRYSVLAGFVGPGETAEAAVIREVREETGLRAVDVRYVTSQPWPFPASLMLGFFAQATGVPRASDGELADVRWFTRAEVAAAVAGTGSLELPGTVSVARRLIDLWLLRNAG